jgi:hypothetical protein
MPIKSVDYQVILPTGFDAAYEPIGFSDQDGQMSVGTFIDPEDRRVFVCKIASLPARRTVGMRLELT